MKYITHKPKRTDFIIWFAVLAVLFLFLVISRQYLNERNPLMLLPISLLALFIFNLLVRKSVHFKAYFTSPYNIFTSKVRSEISFSISNELMFDKVIEVLSESQFTLVNENRENLSLFATAKISWLSWGENLYIHFEDQKEGSILKFCSASLFQIYSWGKNQRNFQTLIEEIEESLTV